MAILELSEVFEMTVISTYLPFQLILYNAFVYLFITYY